MIDISTKHHWCLSATRHLLGNNTSVKSGKSDSLLSSIYLEAATNYLTIGNI